LTFALAPCYSQSRGGSSLPAFQDAFASKACSDGVRPQGACFVEFAPHHPPAIVFLVALAALFYFKAKFVIPLVVAGAALAGYVMSLVNV
jgi:hypothetical protein